jgi:hypothetical protein
MKWSPIIRVFEIGLRPVEYESLRNVLTLLRIFGKEIHDEVQCCLAITVRLVYISTFLNEGFDKPYFKFNHGQVERASIDATPHVYVDLFRVDQDLSCSKLFISNSQAQRGAIILVQDVRVRIPL